MNEKRQLFRHQEKGLEFARNKNAFGLFWEMRLGKTLTAIRIFIEKDVRKVLVVCPKSVINTWVRELNSEGILATRIKSEHFKNLFYEHAFQISQYGWYITNYEVLLRHDLSDFRWDGIILDESDRIKNPKAKISKELIGRIVRTSKKVKAHGKIYRKPVTIRYDSWRTIANRCILTGTPAPENIKEYYQQMKFISDTDSFAQCKSYHQFLFRYFQQFGFNHTPRKGASAHLAALIAEKCSVLKRDQIGLGSKKIYEVRETELEKRYAREYKAFEKYWCTSNQEISSIYALSSFTRLHQLSGGFQEDLEKVGLTSNHKINECLTLLNQFKNDRVVIWFRFLNEIKYLAKSLDSNDYKIWSGKTSDSERKSMENEFAFRNRKNKVNSKVRPKYLLAQIHSASAGLDFAAADQCIYYSNELGNKYRMQSEDRIQHPQKEIPLLYLDLVAVGTICPKILQNLRTKERSQQAFLQQIHMQMREEYA